MDQLFMQLYVLRLIIDQKYYPKMISKLPSFQNYDFDNFAELNADVDDCKFYTQSPLNYKVIVDPTALSEHQSFEDFYFAQQINNTIRDYQISFEADFMEEHQNAFKNQTKNFIESAFIQGEDKGITYQSEEIFGSNLQFGNFSEDEESLQRFEQNAAFLKDIYNEEKLWQYMEFIFKSVPRETASEIVYLASIAWAKHKSNQEIVKLSQQIISQRAKKLAEEEFEKLLEDQRIKFLNLKIVSSSELHSEPIVKKAFKSYLQFIFATVVLVGEEFFRNSYVEVEKCIKRERNFTLEPELDKKEQNDDDGLPKKKLHFE